MDKEIKRLRKKFFLMSSAISFAVIFVMLWLLNFLVLLSYKNEMNTAYDLLFQAALSNAVDTTTETIYMKDTVKNTEGNIVVPRDPTSVKQITLHGTISCTDKDAQWYSAGGGIFFEILDQNGKTQLINKEYKFNQNDKSVTIDFSDDIFFYNGDRISFDMSEVSNNQFLLSDLWWTTTSNTKSTKPDGTVTIDIESIELQYFDNVSIASKDGYFVSYSDFDEIYPEGEPNTLKAYNCFYFVTDTQGNLLEINNGNSSAELSQEQVKNILENQHDEVTVDEIKYQCKTSKNDKYTVYAYMCDTQIQSSFKNLVFISIVSGGGVFLIVVLLVFISSGRVVKPISESYKKQKDFISNASHELKTPVTVISATVELMEKKTGSNRLTECINAQTEKMGRLVNEMLSLSRLSSAEKIQEKFNKINISTIAENSVLYFESRAFEEQKQIKTDIAPNIEIFGNSDKIDELVGILIDNALKYSPEKSEISFSLNCKKDKVIISCKNPCDNFSSEDIPHIFERFYRGDKSHSNETEGYGLGLSIAKEIVELHNASIDVEYEDNIVTFTVKI